MKLNALFDALLKQQTALFKCSITAIITANTLKELKVREKKFRKVASLSLMKFEPLPYMQNLKEGRKEFYIELGSLTITYPFVASELIEDDGILLGLDTTTYAPVIWNYKQRDNYNMVILASSGAGKSVTAKTIANRLLQKNKDTALFIIDPQGEYERLSQLYNATVIRLAEPIPLGLDPFRLFDKRIATNVIADVLNAPEPVRKEILAVGLDPSTNINSISDLYELVGEESKKYLLDLVKDPRLQYEGNTNASYGNRIIFSLKGTYGGSKTMEAFLLTLALAKIWNLIYTLPLQVPKILLIDEGWMLFNIETTAKFVNLIARTGRKLNVILMFLTQKPEDVITNEHGRALLDNAETKILLRNDHTASTKIKDALQLSQQEEDMLPLLQKGECLLIVKRTKLKVKITPSREELEMFATTPF
jgi:DNA helicase HerA-like ATPase